VLSITNRRVATIDCDTQTVDDSVALSASANWPTSMAFSPYRTFVTSVGSPNGYLAVIKTGTAPPAPTPSPAPPTPASPPMGPLAVAGDREASVAWSAPASALTCEVTGLTNGTANTFTVKALIVAGWSVASHPSNAVTPTPVARQAIVISESRDGKRIEVSGSTTGMGMGGLVTPWSSPSLGAFTAGRAVELSMDGTFEWSRRAGRTMVWRVYFTADEVRSNTVIFR